MGIELGERTNDEVSESPMYCSDFGLMQNGAAACNRIHMNRLYMVVIRPNIFLTKF